MAVGRGVGSDQAKLLNLRGKVSKGHLLKAERPLAELKTRALRTKRCHERTAISYLPESYGLHGRGRDDRSGAGGGKGDRPSPRRLEYQLLFRKDSRPVAYPRYGQRLSGLTGEWRFLREQVAAQNVAHQRQLEGFVKNLVGAGVERAVYSVRDVERGCPAGIDDDRNMARR